ncbi:hypothetical protein [Streptomyces sp. NPDC058632]
MALLPQVGRRSAEATLSARLADTESAAAVLTEPVRFLRRER